MERETVDAFKQFEQQGWGNDGVVSSYESWFTPLTAQSVEALLDAGAVGTGTKLLDVATGPGLVAAAGEGRGALPTGLDFSASMLHDARNLCPGLDFLQGDAEALPFTADSFDAVLINYGVLHLAHPDDAIAEAYRVLKPGGRLAFTVWADETQTVAYRIVLGAVREHGRSDVGLPAGPAFFRFADTKEAMRTLYEKGFEEPEVLTIAQTWRLPSADALLSALLDGTVRTRGLLRTQTPESLQAIRAAVAAGVEPYRDGSEIVLPMPAVLSTARKPMEKWTVTLRPFGSEHIP